MLQRRHDPWGGGGSSRGDVARHLPAEPLSQCLPQLRGGIRLGPGDPSSPQRPDGDPPYSRHHQGQAWQCQTDGPLREGLAGDKQDAQMTLRPQGSRPHGRHRDRSQPQAEAAAQDPRRRPSLGLGPGAAQRARRGRGGGVFPEEPPPRRSCTHSPQPPPRPPPSGTTHPDPREWQERQAVQDCQAPGEPHPGAR